MHSSRHSWKYALATNKIKLCLLLCATGEETDIDSSKTVMNLKEVCREATRKHLLIVDPHENLFGSIPQLQLPSSLIDYLLYNISLDDGTADRDNCYKFIDDKDLSPLLMQKLPASFQDELEFA